MQFSREIEIGASPAVVWNVMSDVPRWAEWNRAIASATWITGETLAVGSAARIKQPLQPAAIWTVTEATPLRSFSWQTRNMGMSMVAHHEIQETADGSRVQLTIEASGIGAILMRPIIAMGSKKALEFESEGLKGRAEEHA